MAPLRLLVNGTPVGRVVRGRGRMLNLEGIIPKQLVSDGRMVFSFEFPSKEDEITIGLYHFKAQPVPR